MEIKGAFWKKNSKAGETYYSGNIEIKLNEVEAQQAIAGLKINSVMFPVIEKKKGNFTGFYHKGK
jgi:hypothetical protein